MATDFVADVADELLVGQHSLEPHPLTPSPQVGRGDLRCKNFKLCTRR